MLSWDNRPRTWGRSTFGVRSFDLIDNKNGMEPDGPQGPQEWGMKRHWEQMPFGLNNGTGILIVGQTKE